MHPIIVPILQFIFSASVIYIAAGWLTRASDTIARVTRLGHFLVGSLFLAASTSLPEVFVNVHAAIEGLPNLAAGDLLGASLVNLSILSLCILFFSKRIPDKLQNITASTLLSIGLTALVAFAILIPLPQLWGIGVASYVIVVAYMVGLKLIFNSNIPIVIDKEQSLPASRRRLLKPIGQYIIASVLLFFMAPLLVSAVSVLSHVLGLNHSFMGSTFLALSTSSPELLTSFFAARMGLFDLVLGIIVGSNAFNMIIFAMMDVVWEKGSLWEHFSNQHVIAASIVILNMVLFIVASRLQNKRRALCLASVLILILTTICYALLYAS